MDYHDNNLRIMYGIWSIMQNLQEILNRIMQGNGDHYLSCHYLIEQNYT